MSGASTYRTSIGCVGCAFTGHRRDVKGSIRVLKQLQQIHGNAFILQQFTNLANPKTHYERQVLKWKDTNGEVDVFISSIGTGGTVTGVGRYLKEQTQM